jgi:ribose 5-phosphate isomerase B
MTISIGSDHAGFLYKEAIKTMLLESGYNVLDKGTHTPERVDYPDYAKLVGEDIANGVANFGVLVCGSGIGVSISANKVKSNTHSVRAANCITTEMAVLARAHNDANIVCTGERLVSLELAKEIVTTFLAGTFEGGRHTGRVEKMNVMC